MDFEFDIGDLSEVDWGATEYIVEFTLGFDIENEERISMAVALIEDDEGGADPFALTFGLMARGVYSDQLRGPFFDHGTCRSYVSRGNAPAVMKLVLEALRKLVEEVEPQSIVMVTYETFLPKPAMAKYDSIANLLDQFGFKTTSYRRDETDGKDYWLFEK